jgi:hypothetical protein
METENNRYDQVMVPAKLKNPPLMSTWEILEEVDQIMSANPKWRAFNWVKESYSPGYSENYKSRAKRKRSQKKG